MKSAKKTYPASVDKVLAASSRFFQSVESTFGVCCPQIPLSARSYWVQYQLDRSNCQVKAFFLPRTFYDILTTHTLKEKNNWKKTTERFSRSGVDEFDEHLVPDDQFSCISKKFAFTVNQFVLGELKLRNLSPLLTFPEIENWASSSFFNSPWYLKKNSWKKITDNLDPNMERFPHILQKTLLLECSVHPSSILLYRGSKSKKDATENKNLSKSHSLSFGTSLFAGDKREHRSFGATPWIYCLDKNNDCLAIEVREKENHPFFIPRTDLQMLSYGELFHARTKVPEMALKSKSEISGACFGKAHEKENLDFLQFSGSAEELSDLWKSFQEKAIFLSPP